jgi:hypothetical protein
MGTGQLVHRVPEKLHLKQEGQKVEHRMNPLISEFHGTNPNIITIVFL